MSGFVMPAACALVIACAAPAIADSVGSITGTVSRDGRGAALTIVRLAGDRFAQAVTTDRNGRFVFARVPFGHYSIRADVDGLPAVADVDVATGAVSVVALTADATRKTIGQVSGGTRGVRGTPVSENAILPDSIATSPRGDSLNALVQSVPGVVRFSYNEPVAHGFHGLTYELDGAPLPQSTSSNFSELVDPRNVQALEVFTGAFPAEYGGGRMGAVVNVVSRPPVLTGPAVGALTLGAGSYGTAEARLNESFHVGSAGVSFSANELRSNRGLDAPTPDNELSHDRSNMSDQFLRVVTAGGHGTTLAFDLSNGFAAYQIPVNTNPDDPNNAFVSVPGTDDVQREFDRFASISFTHISHDGLGAVQVVPWLRSSRVAYEGDLPRDVLATLPDGNGGVLLQNGLRQDQRVTNIGLRASVARSSDVHAFKAGLDVSRENERDAGFIELAKNAGRQTSDVTQAGTLVGAYVQDRWALGRHVAINYGLRFDHSTGFVSGAQLSPRVEVNYSFDRATVFHAYFGRLYAAPALEDTRRDAIVTQTTPDANPPYDLKPEHDSYVEFGIAHTYHTGLSLYANAWQRNVTNVLDTTQLLNTPLFAVFNNAIGHASGLELRVQSTTVRDSYYLSTTLSESLAGGISGSTFLFAPSAVSDLTLNPEDHDQAVAINGAYTHRFAADHSLYVTLEPEYGTGYPATFQAGSSGRLPEHLIVNASFGRLSEATSHRVGFGVSAENLFNHQYLIKVNNGFNTTQWAAGRRIVVRLTAAL